MSHLGGQCLELDGAARQELLQQLEAVVTVEEGREEVAVARTHDDPQRIRHETLHGASVTRVHRSAAVFVLGMRRDDE